MPLVPGPDDGAPASVPPPRPGMNEKDAPARSGPASASDVAPGAERVDAGACAAGASHPHGHAAVRAAHALMGSAPPGACKAGVRYSSLHSPRLHRAAKSVAPSVVSTRNPHQPPMAPQPAMRPSKSAAVGTHVHTMPMPRSMGTRTSLAPRSAPRKTRFTASSTWNAAAIQSSDARDVRDRRDRR